VLLTDTLYLYLKVGVVTGCFDTNITLCSHSVFMYFAGPSQ